MNMMNKTIKLTVYAVLIGVLGFAAIAIGTQGTSAKDELKKQLAGASGKEWQLKEIKTAARDMKEEDFDKDEEFDLNSDLAQLVPDTIDFNANGTCKTNYVSQYDDDGDVSDDDYTADCKWSVKGSDVEIIEDVNNDDKMDSSHDEIIVLEKVAVTSNGFKSGFSVDHVYSGGVQQLAYRNR
jgi:hypothetical protein